MHRPSYWSIELHCWLKAQLILICNEGAYISVGEAAAINPLKANTGSKPII